VIDIVVPIYNAPEDLRACIASVFAHTEPSAYRLTLIDDGSPDPKISEYLQEIGQIAPQVQILSNAKNLGFTATVNRAFRETTHDVLLLNSDTVVTPGWLTAMRTCLESAANIATVTPFSNNAEIASVPKWLQSNPVPSSEEAAFIAQACADISDNHWPDLPTGVGFCMLLRRAAINAIGEFDEKTFGRGYGEENDWCQRALKANWRNVLCTSAYVMHTGSQSFSDTKKALVAANIGKLNAKHPGYDLDVQRFIKRDPVAPYRKALASRVAALRDRAVPGVLHILHGKDGGLERHARDLVQYQKGVRHYVLLALGERWIVEDHASGEEVLTFEIEHANDELWKDFFEGVCERFAVDSIHVHHISACREGFLLALAQTNIPYRVTLHDFYFPCPAVHLLKGDNTYCGGQTDVEVCQRCIDSHPLAPRVKVAAWRDANEKLLSKAIQIIAPSDFTAITTQAYFKNIAITTIPHATYSSATSEKPVAQKGHFSSEFPITFAVVGAVGPLKGARNVEAMGRHLRERKIPARIVLIGYLDRQFHASVREGGHFVVHGRYASNELPALLKAYNTSLVLFPAVGPETYGYALSEVWLAGYAAMVADVGTLPDRVRRSEGGWVVPPSSETSIDVWIDHALEKSASSNAALRAQCAAAGRALVEQERALHNPLDYTEIQSVLTSKPLPARRWIVKSPSMVSAGLEGNQNGPAHYGRRVVLQITRWAISYRHTRLGRMLEGRLNPAVKRKLRGLLS
jgi:GT2 family glycosyltransferase/glycosyltransferase involved in cell wall biosynthesis